MFYREIFEETGSGSAFLEHLEAQILENLLLRANLGGASWVQCMYRSAQKNSRYVTAWARSQ